jgi:hypothetical protein
VSIPSFDPTSALAALMAANRRMRDRESAAQAPPPPSAGAVRPLALLWTDGASAPAVALFPGMEGRLRVLSGGASEEHAATASPRTAPSPAEGSPAALRTELDASVARAIAEAIESSAIPLVVLLVRPPEESALAGVLPPGAASEARAFSAIERLLEHAPGLRAAIAARHTRVVAGVASDSGEVRWLGEHPRQRALLDEPRPGAR